jgi:hypothetical protein
LRPRRRPERIRRSRTQRSEDALPSVLFQISRAIQKDSAQTGATAQCSIDRGGVSTTREPWNVVTQRLEYSGSYALNRLGHRRTAFENQVRESPYSLTES